jgi:DNA helicase-2/ATP-dependent DNA helicase PcrA
LRKLHHDLEQTEFFTLTVSHRSTLPIVRFAEFLQQRPLPTEGRPGRAPLWFYCESENVGIPEAIAWLERVARKFPLDLIAVLCRNAEEARLVFSFLEPTFGGAVRLGDRYNFSFEEGIIVTSIEEAKGLEFPSVMIWNPSARTYPLNPQCRNLLYTAATRAEERLAFATWQKPSPILPAQSSPLVRLVAVDEPEPEDTRTGEQLFDNPENLSIESSNSGRAVKFAPPRFKPVRPSRP